MLAEPYGKLIIYILSCMGIANYLSIYIFSYASLRVIFTLTLGCLPLTQFVLHSLRAIYTMASGQLNSLGSGKPTIFDEHIFTDIVLPSDIDYNFHMNNSRYQHQLDFVRIRFFLETGLMRIINARKASAVMTAISSRYRKSLNLFQRYKVKTKILSWDDDSVYLEHRFVAPRGEIAEFVYFICIAKMHVMKASPADILRVYLQTETLPSIEESDELQLFKSYNQTSSLNLRGEFKQ